MYHTCTGIGNTTHSQALVSIFVPLDKLEGLSSDISLCRRFKIKHDFHKVYCSG